MNDGTRATAKAYFIFAHPDKGLKKELREEMCRAAWQILKLTRVKRAIVA
jgi:hypothetical protein